MNNRSVIRCLTFCACACMVLAAAGCTAKKKETVETIENIQKREGIPVRTMVVRPDSIAAFELSSGTAEGYYQTTIGAGMAGRIAAINVRVGDQVARDSSLMVIDPDMPQNYALAKTQYDNAGKARDRVKALAEQGGVSQEVLDQVDAGYAAAKEGMQSALKSQFVLAPFAGTVVSIDAELNNSVDHGKNLVTLAKLDKIRIPMNVSESSINRYKAGQKAYAIVGDDTIPGSIEKVSMAGQSVGHNFEVDAVFNNPGRILKPGMYVTVRVIVANKAGVIAIPMETVISDGARKYVYVIQKGIAKRTEIAAGIRGGDRYEITSGLAAGDTIVESGAGNLTDGALVKIVE